MYVQILTDQYSLPILAFSQTATGLDSKRLEFRQWVIRQDVT
jgi:hypothetical protein